MRELAVLLGRIVCTLMNGLIGDQSAMSLRVSVGIDCKRNFKAPSFGLCRVRSTLVGILAIILSSDILADEVMYSFTATLNFEPQEVVGTNGQTAAEFFDEVVAPGSGQAGEATLTGTISWDPTVNAFNSNVSAAGYVNAITAASIQGGGFSVDADVNDIRQNSATSEFGYNTDATGGFCASETSCAAVGLSFTPTGNTIMSVNDADFRLFRRDGSVDIFNDRDFIGFYLGFTESDSEFNPAIETSSFGRVNVGGLATTYISTEDAAIRSSVAIPSTANFLQLSDVEVTAISVDFDSNSLLDGAFRVAGTITAISVPVGFCNGLPVSVDLSLGGSPTSGPDVIMGTVGDDVINGLGGDDTICGLAGNDIINAGNGGDWVDAGPGNDTVEGGNGDDEIYGDAGADVLNGGPNNDEIYGEADGDFINGNSGDDLLDGGFGVDQLRGGSGNDVINTGSGGNRGSGLVVTGGAGNDIITGGPGTDEIRGESGNDTILGGDASDSLFGGGGNDIVNGQDGNDILRGNGSRDTVLGGEGNDDMDGGDSDDIMSGGNGNDVMRGATGNDEMSGGAGDDEMFGGGGSDVINGNRGDDTLSGGGSNDTLNGGSDTDSCRGDGGTDSAVSCESQSNIP